MLNRAYQPITIDPNKLLIGVSSVAIDSEDIGAISNASLEVTSITKDRYIGYPANRHETITESMSAQVIVVAEEIGSIAVLNILNNLFMDLNEQLSPAYNISMYVPFAGGSNYKLNVKAKLIPELNINWVDDWNSLAFKFECLGTNAQTLVTKSEVIGARLPATTKNTQNLSIGKPRVEINDISVGSIQGLVMNIQGVVKKVELGYPRCVSDILYLSSGIDLQLMLEEGELTSSICRVKIIQAIIDGGAISFEFPQCTVLEDVSLKTQNDWIGKVYKILPYKTDTSPIVVFTRS
jgi:hypothetical protein